MISLIYNDKLFEIQYTSSYSIASFRNELRMLFELSIKLIFDTFSKNLVRISLIFSS